MNDWKLAAVLIGVMGVSPFVRAADPASESSKFELYSWKDGNNWDFSLLPATKSRKLDTEIKHEGGPLRGVDKVKEKLGAMNEGDQISWQERAESGLVYPPDPVMEEIGDYAQAVGVKVSVSR